VWKLEVDGFPQFAVDYDVCSLHERDVCCCRSRLIEDCVQYCDSCSDSVPVRTNSRNLLASPHGVSALVSTVSCLMAAGGGRGGGAGGDQSRSSKHSSF
jgi:hypothetical protein